MSNSRFKKQESRSVSPPWGLNDGNPVKVPYDGNTTKPTSPPWGRDHGKTSNTPVNSRAKKAPPNKDNFSSDLPPWGSSEE